MTAYTVGKRSSDGSSFVLLPLADVMILVGLTSVVDDQTEAEREVCGRLLDTLANLPHPRRDEGEAK